MRKFNNNHFDLSSMTAVVAAVALAGSACSAMGPKANVSIVQAEIKATKNVDNIIVPDASGVDSSGNTGKALLGTALKAYGARARPVAAAKAVLSSAGAPGEVADILTAAYQAEFIKMAEASFKKSGDDAKAPSSMKLPNDKIDFEVPKGVEGIKTMVPKLKAELAGVAAVAGALKSGKGKNLGEAVGKSKNMMAMVQKLDQLLFDKLGVTYLLLTHVIGDEKDWTGGKKIQFTAALVNVKTGKLRYFANIQATKGAIPTPHMAQLGIMSSNLFDAVAEQDELPEPKKNKKDDTASIQVQRFYTE